MQNKLSTLGKKKTYMPEVLIVDDESDIRDLISDILTEENYTTRCAADGLEAIKAVYYKEPDIMLLDIWLKGSELDGLSVLERLKERYPYLPVIMISGHGNIATAVKSLHLGAYDYIEKPFTESRLKLIVKQSIELSKLKRENDELKASCDDYKLIGNSLPIRQLRSYIEKAASTSGRILITGNSGVGKEVIARLIHEKSRESNAPFVTLYSSTIPKDNYFVHIFGSENCNSIIYNSSPPNLGLIEQANGGTLFIDEITDLNPEAQFRLLKLLQESIIYREGGKNPVNIAARIIASSSKDLSREVALRRLREDLYYRLNVLSISVPSLSEYSSDIPQMCEYFIRNLCHKMGLPAPIVNEDALIALQSYSWPGNIRQLRNIIEWILIMKSSQDIMRESVITADDLPIEIIRGLPLKDILTPKTISIPLKEAREEFERQYLKAQLSRFSGNVSRTAEFVGMERSALHRKLKALGLYIHD